MTFNTLAEARDVIGPFIKRYNNKLPKRHGYMTPTQVRRTISRRAA